MGTVAPSADLIARMESQLEEVEALVVRMEPAGARWEAEARPASGEELAGLVDRPGGFLVEHLDEEEHAILPPAPRHLIDAEWSGLSKAGVAKMRRSELPTMFGMFLGARSPRSARTLWATAVGVCTERSSAMDAPDQGASGPRTWTIGALST
jgi:hypothetical protein